MVRKRLIGSGSIYRELNINDLPTLPEEKESPSIIPVSVERKNNQREYVYVPEKKTDKSPINIPASIIAVPTSFVSYNTLTITQGYNEQVSRYFDLIDTMQSTYNEKTFAYMENVMQKAQMNGTEVTNSKLRYTGNWTEVKDFVAREELMKIQIGAKSEIPFDETELQSIKETIKDMDLAKMDDAQIQKLIDNIWQRGYEREYLNALKMFKETGEVSKYLQKGKLEELGEELKDVDFDKLTQPVFKKLVANFIEQREGDHRTSVSADPTKQSTFDNVSVRNTSAHDDAHRDPETGKVNYKRPKYEEALNRKQDMADANSKRVLQKQLLGLGAAVGIAAGIGFSLGFITTLAQSGVSPETLKYAFATGVKSGIESGVFGGVGYAIGQTIGKTLAEGLSSVIVKSLGERMPQILLENIGKMCAMGVVGGLMIAISSVYQFVKLKLAGYSTKECLIRVGKNALVSIFILGLSIAAQGIWGGYAGIIVSVSGAVILVSANIIMTIHDKKVREKVAVYLVELHIPQFARIEMA